MVRRGFLLWEVAAALGVLAVGVFGGLAFLHAEAGAVRFLADRAAALCAATSVLESSRACPPVPGVRAWTPASLASLREGSVVSETREEAPGLLKVGVTVRWSGPDAKPQVLRLDSLVRSAP